MGSAYEHGGLVGRAMSTRDELAKMVRQLRNLDSRGLADALIAQGWRKKPSREEVRDAVAEFICDEYIQGQLFPADYGAADAVLALMDRGQ